MKKQLPTLQEYKAQAKTLKENNSDIASHTQALDALAKEYGYRDFMTIRERMDKARTGIIVHEDIDPKEIVEVTEGVQYLRYSTKTIQERTKDMLEGIDWDEIKHSSIRSVPDTEEWDRVLAETTVRGYKSTLMDYDYYLLLAIQLSDPFKVDADFVYELRTAIREEINHFIATLLNHLFRYEFYNLAALEVFIEFYDEYTASIGTDEEFAIEEYLWKLDRELGSVNSETLGILK